MSSFYVTMEQFQGPIERLLEMIERRKMPINEVSLAAITDEYIQSVDNLQNHELSEKTHFILVASTLTLIKSKSLLPTLELTEEEETDIDELKKRISLLKVFAQAGKNLSGNISSLPHYYHARIAKKVRSFDPDTQMTIESLHGALQEALHSVPQLVPKKKEASVSILIHIEEMMSSLEVRIKKAVSTDFSSFVYEYAGENIKESKQARVYHIVGFLAMLELVRKGSLMTQQEANFSPIHIQSL